MPASNPKRFAAVAYDRDCDVDQLLLGACRALRARGPRIGGIVQRSLGKRGSCASSVDVIDLRTGQPYSIWEQRGTGARGCRLDERGLIDAEPTIMTALADGVDLLVINRFGRAESLGAGLMPVAALDAGIPLLTAVRSPYDEAWRRFHAGLSHDLPPDPDAILAWALAVTAASISAAVAATAPSKGLV